MLPLIIVIGILVVVVVAVIGIYNGIVRADIKCSEAWSGITVQLKRRFDLIPNLVSTVQGYAKHEKDVLEGVTKARTESMGAGSVSDTAKGDNMMSQTLKSLFAVAESYPDLKANQNFIDLQAQLTDCEDKLSASRRFYNSAVTELNGKIQTFPGSVFASMFGKKVREFYNVDEAEAAAVQATPKVTF